MGMMIKRTTRGTLILSCGDEVLEVNADWISILRAGGQDAPRQEPTPAEQPEPMERPVTRDEDDPDYKRWPAPGDDPGVMVIRPIGDPLLVAGGYRNPWSKDLTHLRIDQPTLSDMLSRRVSDPFYLPVLGGVRDGSTGVLEVNLKPQHAIPLADIARLVNEAPITLRAIQLLAAKDEE